MWMHFSWKCTPWIKNHESANKKGPGAGYQVNLKFHVNVRVVFKCCAFCRGNRYNSWQFLIWKGSMIWKGSISSLAAWWLIPHLDQLLLHVNETVILMRRKRRWRMQFFISSWCACCPLWTQGRLSCEESACCCYC